MYSAVTRHIRVTVEPSFLEDQSEPGEHRFVWAYAVRIDNEGPERVQLLNRYWKITDALGQVQEVRGPGVVGEQPLIAPGEYYEYTSGCPLSTPSGFMSGTYEMRGDGGELFHVTIPTFSLDSPHERANIH
jgi:ApaG protein